MSKFVAAILWRFEWGLTQGNRSAEPSTIFTNYILVHPILASNVYAP